MAEKVPKVAMLDGFEEVVKVVGSSANAQSHRTADQVRTPRYHRRQETV